MIDARRRRSLGWLVASLALAVATLAVPAPAAADESFSPAQSNDTTGPLVEAVCTATRHFRNVARAEAAGYGLLHGCVSGPQGGAMGVHFANGELVGDGALDVTRPEVLMYEWRGGRFHLLGAEYVVLAEQWHETHAAPPVLGGQLFTYTGAPNRYGIPAFYALHVWAWKHNPLGAFADWNPTVSCAGYAGGAGGHGH
jgi:hypothetical protein